MRGTKGQYCQNQGRNYFFKILSSAGIRVTIIIIICFPKKRNSTEDNKG
jgi:hypothetical protein